MKIPRVAQKWQQLAAIVDMYITIIEVDYEDEIVVVDDGAGLYTMDWDELNSCFSLVELGK